MTTVFGILRLGQTGLHASTVGTTVASQNASNVATEGYTRRIATTQPLADPLLGVQSSGGRRVIDENLERRLIGARSFDGEASARANTLSVLDGILYDGPGGIGQAIDDFQAAIADLTSFPGDRAVRFQLLERAEELTRVFNRTSEELTQVRADTNLRIAEDVAEVNEKLQKIADLGADIVQTEHTTGEEASDLRDQRDQLVREVADLIPVKVIPEADGSITLLLAGSKKLVGPDATVELLQTTTAPGSGDVSIHLDASGFLEDVTGLISTGEIGGLVSARDGALTTAQDSLDQLAFDIATAYNAAHSVGFGLDGATGRNFFEPPAAVAGAAFNLAVSADILGLPDNIAAATDAAALPGDNRNALALQALATTDIALGGTATASESFGSLVATSATAIQNAKHLQLFAANAEAQAQALRESLSGVNTDEEMISLIQFQRAHQASLKIIQTADEMLQELLSIL